MSVFELYAQYYDETYSDKDYVSEAKFVDRLLRQVEPGVTSILDLGCGTGTHACLLAEMGYTVQGVDNSAHMIEVAERRKKNLPTEVQERVAFTQADIRKARLQDRYDAVVSLFHVFRSAARPAHRQCGKSLVPDG